MNDSSVSYAYGNNADGSISLWYGAICVSSVNSSHNYCSCYTGICLILTSNYDFADYCLSFSCCVNNTASSRIIVKLENGGYYQMKSCNILQNSQKTNSWGIIYAYKNINIYNSYIVENTAQYSLCVNEGTINTYNCSIEGSTTGSVIQNDNQKSKSQNQLHFIQTAECFAEFIKTMSRKGNIRQTRKVSIISKAGLIFKVSLLIMSGK